MTTLISIGALRPKFAELVEQLPIYVQPAVTPKDFEEYCALRSAAYSHRNYSQSVIKRLAQVDEFDLRGVCLLAREKGTNALIGGMRAGFSTQGPTAVLRGMPMAVVGSDTFLYADRFALERHDHAPVASMAIMKGIWLLAHRRKLSWILGAALPGMARRYHMCGLRALNADASNFEAPELHEGVYTAMGVRLPEMPQNMSPAFHDFFIGRHHPDVRIETATTLPTKTSEARARVLDREH